MRAKESIKLGGHKFDVVFTNNSELIQSHEIGNTVLAKNIIHINSDYPKSRQEEALLHEIVHNIFYEISHEQSEELVERLRKYFYMLIKENPGLFIYTNTDGA